MSTSTVAAQLARTETYLARVRFFMVKASVAIVAEDPAAAGHVERVTYAQLILSGGGDIDEMALASLSDPAIQPGLDPDDPEHGVADADLENAINARFSAFAGVATS